MANGNLDTDRARKTIYITGFNPRLINKRILEEIFIQGGPIKDVTLFETHAYILFEHEESVPYCLALFNDIELHGQKLRLSPRFKTKETFSYLSYLKMVRDKLMSEYIKLPPPNLPPRIMPQKKNVKSQKTPNKERRISKAVKDNYKFSGIPLNSSNKKQSPKKSKKSKKPKSRKSKAKYRQKIKIKD